MKELFALCAAAESGNVEEVRRLIAAGEDLDGADSDGNTPLWLTCDSNVASSEDRVAVAKCLLEAGANPVRACQNDSHALHVAARRGPVELVELLIRHGAKEWIGDRDSKLPIEYARGQSPFADQAMIVELLNRPVIRDPIFRAAVTALHEGNEPDLRRLLSQHPNLTKDRAVEPECYPQDYFRDPKLVWFVANNPTLVKELPPNIVSVAELIIDAGVDKSDLDYTLGLVMTSGPTREQGLQRPLMRLLLERGATVAADGCDGTLAHQETDAVVALLENGMPLGASVAAGLGRVSELRELIKSVDQERLHAAFSLAVINRQLEAARICLEAGAEINAFLIVHKHSTAAHQAAVNDDPEMLHLLVEKGADLQILDTLWEGTPLGWAIYTKKPAAEAYLRSLG